MAVPLSLVNGTNAELIASVKDLYLTGSVLDVTYGQGNWWTRFQPEPFACHDLALDGVDFRDLPEADGSWDTVCFDPPYVPRQGPSPPTDARDAAFRSRYGLSESRSRAELNELIAGGMQECARVAREWVLAKSCDYTNGRQFHLGHVDMLNAAAAAGLRCHDLLVLAGRPGPGSRGGTDRARRSHSYLLVLTSMTFRASSQQGW